MINTAVSFIHGKAKIILFISPLSYHQSILDYK